MQNPLKTINNAYFISMKFSFELNAKGTPVELSEMIIRCLGHGWMPWEEGALSQIEKENLINVLKNPYRFPIDLERIGTPDNILLDSSDALQWIENVFGDHEGLITTWWEKFDENTLTLNGHTRWREPFLLFKRLPDVVKYDWKVFGRSGKVRSDPHDKILFVNPGYDQDKKTGPWRARQIGPLTDYRLMIGDSFDNFYMAGIIRVVPQILSETLSLDPEVLGWRLNIIRIKDGENIFSAPVDSLVRAKDYGERIVQYMSNNPESAVPRILRPGTIGMTRSHADWLLAKGNPEILPPAERMAAIALLDKTGEMAPDYKA